MILWLVKTHFGKVVAGLILAILSIHLLSKSDLNLNFNHNNDVSRFATGTLQTPVAPESEKAIEFWTSFINVIERGQPSFPEVRRKTEGGTWIGYNRHHQDSVRPDTMNLTDAEWHELESLKAQAVDDFERIAHDMPFIAGTRGIVTTAHPNSFAILFTSLWMLRASGSQLPVEIWLYDYDQYEEQACDVLFPMLGSKCLFMVDYLPARLKYPKEIVKFTFKALALIFCSFEQVLFLDDDVFPTMNPDSIFDSEPFVTMKAILWPDYWADTASYDLYNMSHTEAPHLETRASTEAGQMLYDKSTHAAPLLLATWFNTYGPEYWHRLASQNAPGEGDKDLWRFSVMAFNLPYYQVDSLPQRVGYVCDGKRWPIGTAQSHPLDDYKILSAGYQRDRDDLIGLGSTTHPRILFIHANLPKLDPYLMLDWGRISPDWPDVLRCGNGTGAVHRLYGDPSLTTPKYGWDMERELWNAFAWMTCQHPRGFKVWWEASYWRTEPRDDLCEVFDQIWSEHFPGQKWRRTVPDPRRPLAKERFWGGPDDV